MAFSFPIHAAADNAQQEAMFARDKALELPTPYVPPPGNPLDHHAAGFAQVICSAVFITGLDPDFAAENIGYFTAPYAERAKLGKPVVDRAAKTVSVAVPGGAVHTARYVGRSNRRFRRRPARHGPWATSYPAPSHRRWTSAR
jgi:hypothetical protein